MRSTFFLFLLSALAIAGCKPPAAEPTVVVKASYPGANAQVVADIVAEPIEQQINGVEGMVSMVSESGGDGSYVACVRFEPGTGANMARTLVQNRVNLALRALPDEVRSSVSVAAETTEKVEPIIVLAIQDRLSRGNAALRQVAGTAKNRLFVAGAIVTPQVFPGPDEKRISVKIDPAKCTALGVSLREVTEVVKPLWKSNDMEPWKAVRVRSRSNELTPLSAFATITLEDTPSAVYRVNMYPAMRITGPPPARKSLKSAAAQALQIVNAELQMQPPSAGFAVEDLTGR